MIELISALLMAGSTPVTNEAARDLVVLRVRAYADQQVDEATIRPALEVADDLLASAGLVVAWRVCDTAQSCPVEDTPVPEIVVILSSRDRQNGRENCGVAAHGARDSAGTVMVGPLRGRRRISTDPTSWNGHQPAARDAQARRPHRSNRGARDRSPARHQACAGRSDACKSGNRDMIALRRGKLRFSPAEAGRMRIAALLAGEERLCSSAAGSPPDPPRQ
jgi:hypothetical protein